MLKIDPHTKSLLPLGRRTLEPAPLDGRFPVLDLVANSADVFFADLGITLFLLGRNVPVNHKAGRRADLLLIDPNGGLLIGRLQQGERRIDLVEALEDAGCVANWSPEHVLSLLDPERRERLLKIFLKTPVENINREQGLLLLGESFDIDTMATAGWLKARYNVRIECFQLRLAVDSLTRVKYLNCQDLSAHLHRVYQRRKSTEPDGAPWPAEAVPDISDGPPPPPPERPAPSLQVGPHPVAAKPAAKAPAPEPAPRPEPEPELELEPASEPDLDISEPPVPEPIAAEPIETEPVAAAPITAEPDEPVELVEPVEPQPIEIRPLEAEVAAALNSEDEPETLPEIEEMILPDDLDDDPLADVIAGLEATAQEPQQGIPPSDRRTAERSRDYQARRLRLDYFGRLLGARLVDFSSVGLGVEALSPLPVGAEIGISGEITSKTGALGIEGRAKVEHCRSTEDGVCRIGFSLEQAQISELDDPETFDRR